MNSKLEQITFAILFSEERLVAANAACVREFAADDQSLRAPILNLTVGYWKAALELSMRNLLALPEVLHSEIDEVYAQLSTLEAEVLLQSLIVEYHSN